MIVLTKFIFAILIVSQTISVSSETTNTTETVESKLPSISESIKLI